MIDHRRDAVVRCDRQKLRLELIALADVDRENPVRQPGLLEEHRYLVAVRRGPVMEVDHGTILLVMEFRRKMRLHEFERIAAQVNGTYLTTRESDDACAAAMLAQQFFARFGHGHDQSGARDRLARDIAAVGRILPDRQPRAGCPPGRDHFRVRPRLAGDPFDEIKHQRIRDFRHRPFSSQKEAAELRVSKSQPP